ncbi:hypothetical protein L1887_61292 [Cichorium endivia]|nr:hypothetical protein L1887_61292 [Cichorium endivia]
MHVGRRSSIVRPQRRRLFSEGFWVVRVGTRARAGQSPNRRGSVRVLPPRIRAASLLTRATWGLSSPKSVQRSLLLRLHSPCTTVALALKAKQVSLSQLRQSSSAHPWPTCTLPASARPVLLPTCPRLPSPCLASPVAVSRSLYATCAVHLLCAHKLHMHQLPAIARAPSRSYTAPLRHRRSTLLVPGSPALVTILILAPPSHLHSEPTTLIVC